MCSFPTNFTLEWIYQLTPILQRIQYHPATATEEATSNEGRRISWITNYLTDRH